MMRCVPPARYRSEPKSPVSRSAAAALILSAAAAAVGCQNPAGTPAGSATPLSPLAPVQGAASLSPMPSTGVGPLGSPTRVPPPPTGSYTPPTDYGSASRWNHGPAGATGVAAGLAAAATPTGRAVAGIHASPNVHTLQPLAAAPHPNSAVRQTGWVSDSPQRPSSPQGSSAQRPSAQRSSAQRSPGASGAADRGSGRGVRAGGMQPIDLTAAPYPPGYVPPQRRPGTSGPGPATPQPGPVTGPVSGGLGQPQNSTFNRSATSAPFGAGFTDSGSPRAANASATAPSLPSTEPIGGSVQSAGEQAAGEQAGGEQAGGEPLQWRRPSPRF